VDFASFYGHSHDGLWIRNEFIHNFLSKKHLHQMKTSSRVHRRLPTPIHCAQLNICIFVKKKKMNVLIGIGRMNE
jgi:hypothetical protein